MEREQRSHQSKLVNQLALPLIVVLLSGLTSVVYSFMFEKSPQLEGRVTRLEEKMKSTHEHIVDIKAQLHSLKDSNQKIYELMIESRK